jgi:putative polyhydroxyalkanoate system protein
MIIRRTHTLGIEEAKHRADHIAETLGKQYAFRSSWRGDRLVVTGNGVNGHLDVTDDNIEMVVKLGFALRLMEVPLRSAIENIVDEELASG